jgi:hypothetical protein
MPEIHISDEDLLALEKAGAQEQAGAEEVLHAAIEEYTSGWRRRRDHLLDVILSEDAKLLRKLGQT